jgi:hypothetical protein
MSDVDTIKNFLKGYDDGVFTEGETVHRILQALMEPHLEHTEKGEESGWSSCPAEVHLSTTKRAIVEVGVTSVRFYPLSWTAPGGPR